MAGNLNPQPAKNSAARAYCAFNLASFTIGTEAADTIKATVQLKDARGQNLAAITPVQVYLSSDAAGGTITPTVPTSTLAIAAKGTILAVNVTDKMLLLACDVNGQFDLNIIQTAAPVTYYLCVRMPDGSLSNSGAITFA